MKEITLTEPSRNKLTPIKTVTALMTDEEYLKLEAMIDYGNWHCSLSIKEVGLSSAEDVRKIFQPRNYKFNGE